jgi:hypothetical protein
MAPRYDGVVNVAREGTACEDIALTLVLWARLLPFVPRMATDALIESIVPIADRNRGAINTIYARTHT